eukprot:361335-Chlamydomonas_euryale.AAC.3
MLEVLRQASERVFVPLTVGGGIKLQSVATNLPAATSPLQTRSQPIRNQLATDLQPTRNQPDDHATMLSRLPPEPCRQRPPLVAPQFIPTPPTNLPVLPVI